MDEGTCVASYIVVRPLGAGSHGFVWEGRQRENGARVALKRLLPAAQMNEEVLRRFRREAALLRRVTSERVARIVDFVEDPTHGTLLVTELIEGESLRDVLATSQPELEEVVALGVGLLAAVADVHAAGIVHRDLKPSNVVLRPKEGGSPEPILLDFGLARTLPHGGAESSFSCITQTNMTIGSVHYMAPEQVLDGRSATEQSDLYAVAAILYFASTGKHPFGSDEASVARSKLMFEAPPPELAGVFAAALPACAALEAVIMKGLRRHPHERFDNARAMMTALASIPSATAAEPSPSLACRTEAEGPEAPKRGRAIVAVVLTALALVALASTFGDACR